MRALILAVLIGFSAGCGSSPPPGPLTDEQNKKIAEEDKKIADEESQGSVGRKKAGQR